MDSGLRVDECVLVVDMHRVLSCQSVNGAQLPKSRFSQNSVPQEQDDEGKSRGFGFINFDTPEAAAAAVEKNNGTLLEGKELWCGRAQKKSEREAELKQKWVFASRIIQPCPASPLLYIVSLKRP